MKKKRSMLAETQNCLRNEMKYVLSSGLISTLI
jgi:hypothetical protein